MEVFVSGVRIRCATADRTTLEKIGIDHGRSPEFCNLLKNKFDIKIAKEMVPNLTIEQ